MKTIIALISLFLICFSITCIAQKNDSVQQEEYGLLMKARGHDITGLCIISTSKENGIVGTIVNEFGIKVFDFTYCDGKARILNVIAPLDKWYIRKVLRRDFRFILSNIDNIHSRKNIIEKKCSMTILANGDVEMDDLKYKIIYTFTRIKEDE